MKAPVILVLISTLVAAPLFADTITLKNGQIYEGEILEKTSEYIKLKMESEVLRIELSTITRIETPGRLALTPDILAKAEAAAEAEVNKMLWFGTGCCLNLVGVFMASSVKPSPPPYHLIGKSPEYVAAFAEVYEQKAESIQRSMAMTGCLASTVVGGCFWFFLYALGKQMQRDF